MGAATPLVEMGPYGIPVNVVAPGPIRTGSCTSDRVSDIADLTPFGYVGQPDDVTEVIVSLVSAQGHRLIGRRLCVGGGLRMQP